MSILSLMWDGFISIFENIFNSFSEFFAVNMVESMGIGLEMLNFTFVKNVIHYSQMVALSLIVLLTAYHATITYILWKEGNPSGNPSELIKQAITGVILVAIVPWLVVTVYSFGSDLAMDIARVASFDTTDVSIVSMLTMAVGGGIAFLVCGLVCLIMWIIVIIQSYIRAAEVVFLAIAGPLLVLRGFSELASHWWKNLVSISITQAVVIIYIKLAIVAITHFSGSFIKTPNHLLLLIAILWIAVKTPSVIKEYAYSSGIGRGVTGATQSVGSFYLMRKAFTKGV